MGVQWPPCIEEVVAGVCSDMKETLQGLAFICRAPLHSCVWQEMLHMEGLCKEANGHRKVEDHKSCWATQLCWPWADTKASAVDIYPHYQAVDGNIAGRTQHEGEDNYQDRWGVVWRCFVNYPFFLLFLNLSWFFRPLVLRTIQSLLEMTLRHWKHQNKVTLVHEQI